MTVNNKVLLLDSHWLKGIYLLIIRVFSSITGILWKKIVKYLPQSGNKERGRRLYKHVLKPNQTYKAVAVIWGRGARRGATSAHRGSCSTRCPGPPGWPNSLASHSGSSSGRASAPPGLSSTDSTASSWRLAHSWGSHWPGGGRGRLDGFETNPGGVSFPLTIHDD